MTPKLKEAIKGIINAYYKPAKKNWEQHAFNKKPACHPFINLEYLKSQIQTNRKLPKYTLICQGKHEIEFLCNVMIDLLSSLDSTPAVIFEVNELKDRILVYCAGIYPRSTEQINLNKKLTEYPGLKLTLDEGKQIILARIRNLLLNANI